MTDSEKQPPSASPGAGRIRQIFFSTNRGLRILGVIVVAASVVAAGFSFLVLMGATPLDPEPEVWGYIWAVNAALVLLVIALLITEAWMLVQSRVRKQAGSRLHVRLVITFAAIAAVPALLVAVVATLTLNQGLDYWFSERNRVMVENSRLIARSYMLEHAEVLRDDIVGVAAELEQARNTFESDQSTFQRIFTNIVQVRALPYAMIIDGNKNVVMRAQTSSAGPTPGLPEGDLSGVTVGQPTLISPGRTNLIGGIVGLRGYQGLYLFVARPVDAEVLEYMRLTDRNVSAYREYESSRLVFQLTFAILYFGLAVILLLAAVWVGIAIANRLVAPIRNLMVASNRVSEGDLEVQVPLIEKTGDMHDLSDRFNRMTLQLNSQRQALLQANQTMDQRRQFTEAVLEGVSAGVVGLDQFGRITLLNGRASLILATNEPDLVGMHLSEAVPELETFLEKAAHARRGKIQEQITLKRFGEERIYQVRATREGTVTDSKGFVFTLDDITDLVAAQRTSAWADVARRIAHEIKNPLTPIQLSAERLRRRYSKKLEDDFEVFDKCTSTIVRQVGDIGRMVDEFSAFARMPTAQIQPADLAETVRQAVFMEGVRHAEIEVTADIGKGPVIVPFDDRLMSQALINLIKNAAEAIEGADMSQIPDPHICVSIEEQPGSVCVKVSDNGVGWPGESRQRLLEPYMTTREKGTGLGLAIVSKIIEQHGGTIELLDSEPDESGRVGACFAFTLPRAAAETAPETPSEGGEDPNKDHEKAASEALAVVEK
ncbi:sensor histidine kinase NtrY-like [Cucumibacter marinus]|uniref:sensor histidine kinase NtrY-like n=1 Tax=Cucumibacter marinus TaxID=1121252 RepID=UPI00040DDBEC|nr:PAS domain-containing sensor histidine kinase [Cucumibacter marinus]